MKPKRRATRTHRYTAGDLVAWGCVAFGVAFFLACLVARFTRTDDGKYERYLETELHCVIENRNYWRDEYKRLESSTYDRAAKQSDPFCR
jgi:hypothetical protein